MRTLPLLVLAAGLAGEPLVATAEPCRGSHGESFEMMSISKGRLGALVLGITPELRKHYGVADDRGVLVARVERGSPAAAAGLQAGDIITDAGGRAIDEAGDLIDALASVAKGTSVELKVVRDRKPLSLSAKLTADPVSFMGFDWFREMLRRFEQPVAKASSSST